MEIPKGLSVNQKGTLIEMGSNLNISEYLEKWTRTMNIDGDDFNVLRAALEGGSAPEINIHSFLIVFRIYMKKRYNGSQEELSDGEFQVVLRSLREYREGTL